MEILKNIGRGIKHATEPLVSDRKCIELIEKRINHSLERNLITEQQGNRIREELTQRGCRRYAFDAMIATPLIEIYNNQWLLTGPILYTLFKDNSEAIQHFIEATFLPTTVYTAARALQEVIQERSLHPAKARMAGLLISPIPIARAFSLPFQAALAYPEMGSFLLSDVAQSGRNFLRKLWAPGKALGAIVYGCGTRLSWSASKLSEKGWFRPGYSTISSPSKEISSEEALFPPEADSGAINEKLASTFS